MKKEVGGRNKKGMLWNRVPWMTDLKIERRKRRERDMDGWMVG